MTNQKEVKLYRNPKRDKPVQYKPYIPQYQQMGLAPKEYHSPTASGNQRSPLKNAIPSQDNPRLSRPIIRQSYAEPLPSPVGRGRGLLPNVGNNLEQTWSSVGGEIIDDISGIDPNEPMIDNNDYVSAEALGLPPEGEELDAGSGSQDPMDKSEKSFLTEEELQNVLKENQLSDIVQQLQEDSYLLLVNGECICYGSFEEVQDQARELAFGDHSLCDGDPVPVDDIVVLKRVQIKVGLFLS